MPIEGIDTGHVGVDETEARHLSRFQRSSQLGDPCLNDIEVIHLNYDPLLPTSFRQR